MTTGRTARWVRLIKRLVDALLPPAIGLFLVGLVAGQRDLSPALTMLGILASLAQGGALWWRRTHPEIVMAVALAGGVVVHWLAPEGVFPFAGLIALGSLAAARPPRISLLGLAGLLGVTALNYLTATDEDATFAMVVAVVPWALGEAVRNRRISIEQEARRAVSEEQARIARELHDVLAHSVSVIVVQAAAADDVFDERPDQARAALRAIEQAGRQALGELRLLLSQVRPDGDRGTGAGLQQLDELAAPLRSAGLEVTVRHEGSLTGPVPASVDVSAYRIVQEALTNTLRHARAHHAEVTVRVSDSVLELEVTDDGHPERGRPGTGSGRGIAGMRERASLAGGTLEAGPAPQGGFRVYARLPLEAGS